jgi:hypothetical protein
MKRYLSILMSSTAILTSCSYVSGASFLVLSPGPEEFRAVLTTIAAHQGFTPKDCGEEAREYEHAFCAEVPSEKLYPLDLFAFSDGDDYHLSLYVFLDPSSQQQAIIRKLVTELSHQGVEMCLSRERSSGLSKAESKRLRDNCT